MDPRWIIALWDEWRAVAIHASEGEKEVVMMETYSGLEPYIQPFKGLTIERLSKLICSFCAMLNGCHRPRTLFINPQHVQMNVQLIRY